MPEYKLDYFDFHGGRGEVTRLIMAIGGIEFEDNRIAVPDWPAVRDQAPFRALPVLHIDGEAIAQSNAMNRYLGKLAGLYPDDPLEALRCDEVCDAVEDILTKVVVTFGMKDEDEKKSAREALAEGPIRLFLETLQAKLERGGDYYVENRVTIADIKVFVWIRSLRAGILDYIPGDIVESVAPKLAAHCDRVAAHPGIQAWYEAK